MKLKDLFDIRNGVVSSGLSISPTPAENHVPYLRPASTQQRTIAGWVSESEVGSKNIYPENTLFVSTNGEGSHSYSYVSRFKFACNSDVSALLPKREMTFNEKVYYARCITMNRYKFSYGRKPKGDRLKQIELPENIPSWVHSAEATDLWAELARMKTLSADSYETAQHSEKSALVRVQDLFEVRYGHSLELNRLQLLSKAEGGIPFVSRVMGNNGVSAYVAPIDGLPPILGGVLSCALGGNGVLSTFLQEVPFYSGRDSAYLVPKFEMTTEELLYYCSCIWQNRFRFSYGRQANRTLKGLLIPTKESIPSWVHGSLSRVSDKVMQSNRRC
ncbi:restriction enzyme subunit beta [Aeromonas diversa CDC 2478-85]|uniref:Restriction enzyme subunit beta n=1 Tax=Aeromonas diversa CDC 2478-85 TaxID=1268237 RepID=N9U5F5_9GAMM|nr:restriction endonuclease subunit S [Aeromonas diversa]ENY73625.1 restriction enzyme subunit beta [Aeromonas diversa CDC 2478-85]